MGLEIRRKLKASRTAYRIATKGRLSGPFAVRSGIECHAHLDDGTEVHMALPAGEVLREGDLAVASDGRVIEVAALPEPLVELAFEDAGKLAAAAYLLGSTHVPAELRAGSVRIARVDAETDLLAELGGARSDVQAVFDPTWIPHVHADDDAHHHDHHDHAHHDHDHHGHDHHGHDHGHRHGRAHGHGDHGHEHD